MSTISEAPVTRGRKTMIIVSHTVAVLFAVAVAAVNGTVSWHHGVAVAAGVGESQASLFPLAYDGMMLSGAALAYVDTLRGFTPRAWSVVGLWLGTALTLLFNVLSAYARGWSAMAIAAVYAVTFLITVESLFHPSRALLTERRARRGTPAAEAVPAEAQPPVVTVEPATAPVEAVPAVEAAPAVKRRSRARSSSAAPARGVRKAPAMALEDEADVRMVSSSHE